MFDPSQPDYTDTPVSARRPRYPYSPACQNAEPAVSLVTPFYNTGPLFHETAASVFQQSFQQWEWIIVDDASDDPKSMALIECYARQDSRIRLLRSPLQRGPGAARNLGAAEARSPYLAFLDSDDLYEPTTLEKWLWFLESHPHYAMVKGFQVAFGAKRYLWRRGFHSGREILENNTVQTASMIRRDVYLAVGGMDESIAGGMEDWDFWLKCAERGYWGGTVPEFLDWYRTRASHNDRWSNWDRGPAQAAFGAELRERHPSLYQGAFPAPQEPPAASSAETVQLLALENHLAPDADRRRLLILVPHLVLGGSDKFVLDLMAELIAKHGFDVTIATTRGRPHPWRPYFEALTPDVFTLDTFLRLSDAPRFLAYLIRSRGIDSVLVTHSELGYRLLPYLRSRCPGVRFYDYVHIEEPAWKSGGYPAMSVAHHQFLDRTAASSQHLKDWMVERGAQSAKVSVITTNIDTESWRRDRYDAESLRLRWDVSAGVPVILFAGRLCAQKQPAVLAHTLRFLEKGRIHYLCLIAGGGELEAWLREFIRKNGIRGARLIGPQSNENVKELLALSDILFLPSKHEGIALTIYEAMAMGVVPVSAAVGGQAELVTPECGVLITPGENEVARYAEALERLLGDRALRIKMAEAARDRVANHYRLDQMGQEMAAMLSSAPRRHREPSARGAEIQASSTAEAREVIEQYRLEAAGEWKWHAPPGAQSKPAVPILQMLAILRPLFIGQSHASNRKLFLRVLWHPPWRHKLIAAFDRSFYAAEYPDVPKLFPFPQLHYVFYGYREERLPSPTFDTLDFALRYPGALAQAINPLLYEITHQHVAGKHGVAAGRP